MKFYDPKKTFLEIVVDYDGDLEEAHNLFMDGLDDAGPSDKRDSMEALGIKSKEDLSNFLSGKYSIKDLLKKYGMTGKAAASVKG